MNEDEATVLWLLPTDVVRLRGAERIDLLHRLSTADLRQLGAQESFRQAVLTTELGKIVDWLHIFAVDDELLLRVAAGRGETVQAWIERFIIMEDVACQLDVEQWLHAIVVGPKCAALVGTAALEAQRWRQVHGVRWVPYLASGVQGADGLCAAGDARALRESAANLGIEFGDSESWQRQRLLHGIPAASSEFLHAPNPLELRLSAAVSWNKGCYIGQEVIARLDTYDKVARVLMGWHSDSPIEAVDLALEPMRLWVGDKRIGRITSVAQEPGGKLLALAMVERAFAKAQEARLATATESIAGALFDRPFWRHSGD